MSPISATTVAAMVVFTPRSARKASTTGAKRQVWMASSIAWSSVATRVSVRSKARFSSSKGSCWCANRKRRSSASHRRCRVNVQTNVKCLCHSFSPFELFLVRQENHRRHLGRKTLIRSSLIQSMSEAASHEGAATGLGFFAAARQSVQYISDAGSGLCISGDDDSRLFACEKPCIFVIRTKIIRDKRRKQE